MAYTPVPALAAPSRGGDPDNFPGEVALFLGVLASYGPAANNLATYLNALPFLKYQWGTIVETNPTRPSLIATFPPRSVPADSGLVRTGLTDAVLAANESLAPAQNLIGAYMDALSLLSGAVSFVADASRPLVSAVNAPPLRGDSPATFESKAVAFYNSLATHSDSLDPLVDYYRLLLVAAEDWDLVTAAVDSTDDFGLLTESADG